MPNDIVDFTQVFSPAEATRGQFVPIRTSVLSAEGYPLSGRGRYAVLTYSVGSLSGTCINVTNTTPLTTTQLLPNTMYVKGGITTQLSSVASTIIFDSPITLLEVFNNSSDTTYMMITAGTSFETLTAQGLPIPGGSFYNIEREITSIVLGADGPNSDARIFGHYRS